MTLRGLSSREYGTLACMASNSDIPALTAEQKSVLQDCIRKLVSESHAHPELTEKFRNPANLVYLDKALLNAACPWQMALVADWALDREGLAGFDQQVWQPHFPELPLAELIRHTKAKYRFDQVKDMKDYRHEVMHRYPRVSAEELEQLNSDDWRSVIDAPSGRIAGQDIPAITPFVKQGDIEHSLLRHYLVPELSPALRSAVKARSEEFDLTGSDTELMLGIPVALNQLQAEVQQYIKTRISSIIRDWAASLHNTSGTEPARALAALERIWEYKRAASAADCNNPVENIIKGFTATTLNSLSHFMDTAIAVRFGEQLDPREIGDKYVLAASVSNGQLNNLAVAYQRYQQECPNPRQRNNQGFLTRFLQQNRNTDLHHIQAHFLIDKNRGCPAMPQIPRFHQIVLDLVLDFSLEQFGEQQLREAGRWYQQQVAAGPQA